jgi:recombination protein RecR
MKFSPVLEQLIQAMQALPSVGQKTAQRMVLQLLEHKRPAAAQLAAALTEALERIGHCQQCRVLSEQSVCDICASARRDAEVLCVVESPSDLLAIEQTGRFAGKYFVLRGNLSPLDGRGPEEVGIPALLQRIDDGAVREVILATSSTLEGEATALYLAQCLAGRDVLLTQLAQGIPVGGSLGYIDGNTLGHAFSGRRPVSHD